VAPQQGWGYGPSGGLGLVVVILLALLLWRRLTTATGPRKENSHVAMGAAFPVIALVPAALHSGGQKVRCGICECPVRRVLTLFRRDVRPGRKGKEALPGPELPRCEGALRAGTNPTRPRISWDLAKRRKRMFGT